MLSKNNKTGLGSMMTCHVMIVWCCQRLWINLTFLCADYRFCKDVVWMHFHIYIIWQQKSGLNFSISKQLEKMKFELICLRP